MPEAQDYQAAPTPTERQWNEPIRFHLVDSMRHRPGCTAALSHLDWSRSLLRHSQTEQLVADSVSHSLRRLFVERLGHLSDVEAIYWLESGPRVRVWTMIDEPSLDVENAIYEAELQVMDLLADLRFDFSIIFRRGKDPRHVSPRNATQIFARP